MKSGIKWALVMFFALTIIALGGVGVALARASAATAQNNELREEQHELSALGTPAYGVMDITIKNGVFVPRVIEVPVGAVVTWTNKDSAFHDVVLPRSMIAQNVQTSSGKLGAGQSFTYTFLQPGTFTFYCSLSPDMEMNGIVIVME
ncbi:MAG TPA: plastocyanin/azurin family copper-binding protein [Ktedonobacteraceae bacterium]|nr:plastocyanin/azurin family copper-binding protein [Ktedonobacteraceae bacterium]